MFAFVLLDIATVGVTPSKNSGFRGMWCLQECFRCRGSFFGRFITQLPRDYKMKGCRFNVNLSVVEKIKPLNVFLKA